MSLPLKDDVMHDSEWYLKFTMLNFMFKITGIKSQKRDCATAYKLCSELGNPTNDDIFKVFEYDMLSGFAWYQYADINQSSGGDSFIWAMFSSAVLDLEDNNLRNAKIIDLLQFLISMGQDADSGSLALHIINFILSKADETELVDALTEISERFPDSANKAQFINMFYAIIQQAKEMRPKKRFLSDYVRKTELMILLKSIQNSIFYQKTKVFIKFSFHLSKNWAKLRNYQKNFVHTKLLLLCETTSFFHIENG